MRSRLYALSALGAAGLLEPASAAETIRVAIDKLTFAPAQVSAHVGDTIEWLNHDPSPIPRRAAITNGMSPSQPTAWVASRSARQATSTISVAFIPT